MAKTSKTATGAELAPVATNTSLMALTGALRTILEIAEENDGELTEEQLQSLEITREQMSEKIINYRNFIQVLESQRALAMRQIEDLRAWVEKRDKMIGRLETNLLTALMQFGEVDKSGVYRLEVVSEQGIVNLSTRKSEQCVIINEDEVPAEYWTVPKAPEPKPNKTLIKSTIKEGTEVPGAKVETVYNLSIK